MPLKPDSGNPHPKTLGLIAGMGSLPLAITLDAQRKGYRVIAIALQPPADESLKGIADEFYKIRLGSLGKLLSLIKKNSITEIVMAGKVPKDLLYKNKRHVIPDIRAAKLLLSLKNQADDTIMNAIVEELEKTGAKILKTTAFTKDLLAPEGILSKKKPSKEAMKDIAFGWEVARKIGKMDIGQTVVVKDMAVMAVEAIEGTDEAIKRGGDLARKDAVVVKVSKPQQDMRFDVPTVGSTTLASMKQISAKVLALEAGKCIILDREHFIKEADRAGISVIGITKDIKL